MRLTNPTRAVLALAVAGAGMVSCQSAFAAPETVSGGTPVAAFSREVLQLPADVRDYTNLGNLFATQPMLAPNGNLQWILGRQQSTGSQALGEAEISLTAPAAINLNGQLSKSSARRTDAFRYGSTFGGLSAVDGGNWFIDRLAKPKPARDRLVRFDDRLRVNARINVRAGVQLTRAIPTSQGVRLLGNDSNAGKKPRGVIIGPKGKLVRNPYLESVSGAAALPDGSLILAGHTRSNTVLPDPVIVVSPKGKLSRAKDRRRPGAADRTATFGITATKLGAVMDERSAESALVDRPAIVVRNGKGKVTLRKAITDMEYPRPAECANTNPSDPKTPDLLLSLAVGPDGLPMIRVVCQTWQQVGTPGTSKTDAEPIPHKAFMLGLNTDLSVRWWRPAPEVYVGTDVDGVIDANWCGTDRIAGNGQLYILDCKGTLTSVAVPGALTVTRGTLKAFRADGKKSAGLTISCKGDYGAVCSGTAEVSTNGGAAGSAPYALPARPGKAASSTTIHVPTTAALPKKFTVSLKS